MELTISKKKYSFKFGVKFIRALDVQMPIKQEGVNYGLGLTAKVLPELRSANVDTLAQVLYLANQTEKENVTLDQLDDYIDEIEDIEALFDAVLDDLGKSNAGKLAVRNFNQATKKTKNKK